MRLLLLFILAALLSTQLVAQPKASPLVAGPMLGYIEFRTAIIWAQFTSEISKATIRYAEKTSSSQMKETKMILTGTEFNTAKATLTGLAPGTTYLYSIHIGNDSKKVASGELTTQTLWQFRSNPPAFSFITGSCAYFNEPEYDRPGKPYGKDSSIFITMAKENAAFMLWLGDNWYTREPDFRSAWGLYYRASRDRSLRVLQDLLKKMPQFAIWDDHDYGPNNADKSYIFKKDARNVFVDYWANPSFGEKEEGTYTKITWNDVDLFLMDDRWWRSNDELPDSINNLPNTSKRMFGEQQLEWLKNELLVSKTDGSINFRIIVTGSQVLNTYSPFDCLRYFPTEYQELLDFISDNHIGGLMFLTGDRHHSEIIKQERNNIYPLYDITSSPLTSSVATTHGGEKDNPTRVSKEIDAQNYARITFTGPRKDRKMTVSFIGIDGNILGEWSVMANDLKDKGN